MKKFLIYILQVFVVFIIIYYPPIFTFNVLHLLAVIAYIVIISNKRYVNELSKIYSHSKLLLFILSYSFLIFAINGTLSNISDIFLQYFELIPICYVAVKMIENRKVLSLDNIIISAATLQAILSTISFINPAIQSFFISLFLRSGFNDIFEKMAGWRMYGFSYTLAYAMPVVQSTIAAYCYKKSITNSPLYFIPLILILFSSIINARTGIVIFGVGACFVLLICATKSLKLAIKSGLSIIVLLLIPLLFLEMLGDSSTLEWILEGTDDIKTFTGNGDYSDTSYFSYATSAEQYRLNPDILATIFGSGLGTTRGNSMYSSDVGFINQIWSIGIIGLLLTITFFFSNTIRIIKQYSIVKERRILILGVLTILFISNIKGSAFAWNEITELWFLCFVKYNIDLINTSKYECDIYKS